MPSAIVYVDKNLAQEERDELAIRIREQVEALPEKLRAETLVSIVPCGMIRGGHAGPAFAEIRTSRGTQFENLIRLANALLPVVDVEIPDPQATPYLFRASGGDPFTFADLR